jgi:outer membrane protein TolC
VTGCDAVAARAPHEESPAMHLPIRSLGALSLALVVGLWVASPAAAQDPEPSAEAPAEPGSEPEPAAQPDLGATPAPPGSAPALHDELSLSLADAIRMGLENNLDVELLRYDPYIAYEDTEIAWGAFDPNFASDFGWDKVETPNANALIAGDVTTTKVLGGSGGFAGFVPLLGSVYQARFGGNQQKTDVSLATLSPEYNSTWSIGLTQPLLKDLIWNAEWTNVKLARIGYDFTLEGFRKDVMDAVQRIQNLYWNLIAREDQVRVAEKSLETARALLGQTQTQHDVGVVSKVQVVEAEAGVAQREFELIRAQNLYRNSQDQLIDAVLGPGLTADSTLQIQPSDRPEDYVPYDVNPEVAVQSAFEHRPEMAQANKLIEQRDVQRAFARNQQLPSLDAQVAYGNEGIAGKLNPDCGFGGFPCGTPTVGTQWNDSLNDFGTSTAAEQITARAIFSIPIPNTSARHRASQAELELRRANSQKRRLEQSIILEVRTAVRNLTDSQKGIEAARRARAAAAEQLRAERIRLEYGESTPFEVLQRESDYVRAESEEINAFQAYRTSATGLDRAQGTILRNSNVSIDEVRALR